jgi:hypothetical protein
MEDKGFEVTESINVPSSGSTWEENNLVWIAQRLLRTAGKKGEITGT